MESFGQALEELFSEFIVIQAERTGEHFVKGPPDPSKTIAVCAFGTGV
jgi:hypothetical protein